MKAALAALLALMCSCFGPGDTPPGISLPDVIDAGDTVDDCHPLTFRVTVPGECVHSVHGHRHPGGTANENHGHKPHQHGNNGSRADRRGSADAG